MAPCKLPQFIDLSSFCEARKWVNNSTTLSTLSERTFEISCHYPLKLPSKPEIILPRQLPFQVGVWRQIILMFFANFSMCCCRVEPPAFSCAYGYGISCVNDRYPKRLLRRLTRLRYDNHWTGIYFTDNLLNCIYLTKNPRSYRILKEIDTSKAKLNGVCTQLTCRSFQCKMHGLRQPVNQQNQGDLIQYKNWETKRFEPRSPEKDCCKWQTFQLPVRKRFDWSNLRIPITQMILFNQHQTISVGDSFVSMSNHAMKLMSLVRWSSVLIRLVILRTVLGWGDDS